ncbi:MAG: lysostaphin resistance A-like protein [Candidatus Udaeobacter sp.]
MLKRLWNRLPVIVRAIGLGWVVFTIGSTVTFLPLLGNLKFHPEIPWAFPMTVVVLVVFGAYFSGWGPPAATRDARKKLARASLPSARIWGAAIPAMVFGIVALVALRLLLPSLMPVRAPSVSISLSSYPLATIIGALISIAAIAAVTEEIAFRGYMQQPLEEAYGIIPAVLIVGIMFWVAHLDHGITITHLPFQMSASIGLGFLVYVTRSLIPAMIAHCAADILLQPAYLFRHPEFVWKALSARPVWEGVASAFPERLLTIGWAMSPNNMFAGNPFPIFAIIAWILLISALLTVLAFFNLLRATRLSNRPRTDIGGPTNR